jgi:ketosteroid isomerase-like protein
MRTHSAFLVCLILSCKSGSPGTDAPSDRDQSSTSGNQQSDEQAIREAESRWRKILTQRDTAAIDGFYAEDAVYAPQGSPAFRGRDSVSRRWSREFRIPGFQLERTPLRIEAAKSGDLANEVGTYLVRFRDKGQMRQGGGTYMTGWRKEGGEWKIVSYMWNRNEPENGR